MGSASRSPLIPSARVERVRRLLEFVCSPSRARFLGAPLIDAASYPPTPLLRSGLLEEKDKETKNRPRQLRVDCQIPLPLLFPLNFTADTMEAADSAKKNGRPDAATLNDDEQKPTPPTGPIDALPPKPECAPFTGVLVLSPPIQHAALPTDTSDQPTPSAERQSSQAPPLQHLPPRPQHAVPSSPGPSYAPRGSEADLRARLAAESRRLAESQSRGNSAVPQDLDHSMASPTVPPPMEMLHDHRLESEHDHDYPGPDAAPHPNPSTVSRPSTSANVKTVIERVVTAGIALDQLGPLLGLLTSILEDAFAFENRARNDGGSCSPLKADDVDSTHPAAGLPPSTVPPLLSCARLESIDKLDNNFADVLQAVQSLEQQLLIRLPRAPAAKPLVVPPLPTKAVPLTAVVNPPPLPAANAPSAEPSLKARASPGPIESVPSSTSNIFSRLGINGTPVSPPPRVKAPLPVAAPRAASPPASRMDVDPPRPRAVSPPRPRAASPPRRAADARAPIYRSVANGSYPHPRPASPPYARPLTPLDPPRPLADRLPPPARSANELYKSPYPIPPPYPARPFQGPHPRVIDHRQRSCSPPPKRLVAGGGGRYSPPPYVPPRGTFGTPPPLPPQSFYGPPQRGYDDRRPGPPTGTYDDRRASGVYDEWDRRPVEEGGAAWEGGTKRGRNRSRSRSPGRGPMLMNSGGVGGRR